MTSEIAILNRYGVALAADSAVTIPTRSGPKIYDSVNKLFVLVKQRPVGIMIYDSADLLSVPWETIIKTYRMRHRGAQFDSLNEYAEDFLRFITETDELIPTQLRDSYFAESLSRRVGCMVDAVRRQVEAVFKVGRRSVGVPALREFIDDAISDEEEVWSRQPDGPWSDSLDLPSIERDRGAEIEALVLQTFQQLPLIARQRRRIRLLLISSLAKVPYMHRRLRVPVDPRSGIVIAGFGEKEFFPRLLSYEINGIVNGRLLIVPRRPIEVAPDNPAIIVPFAQQEMVHSFIRGIHGAIERSSDVYWGEVEHRLPEAVLGVIQSQLPGLDDHTAHLLRGSLRSLVLSTSAQYKELLRVMKNRQVQPILNSVAFLPKDELAAMAESLVNLTTLKRRVSINEPQTVGGPIDVAVISRGDGFVWIRRKHYFTQELNPSWAVAHAEG